MVKYFCECCGEEMDNSSSRKIMIMSKNPKVKEELNNEEYSACDDHKIVCEECSFKILSFIEEFSMVEETSEERPNESIERSKYDDPNFQPHGVAEWIGWIIGNIILFFFVLASHLFRIFRTKASTLYYAVRG